MKLKVPPVAEPGGFDQPPGDDWIEDPLTGEMVSVDDVDALIDLYENIKKTADELWATKTQLQKALAAKTEGTAKMRRVVGQSRKVKIEMPGASWEQSKLKECFHSYPAWRDDYLRISTLSVKLVEYKKLVGTTGPDDFDTFKKMLMDAEGSPTGTPRVSIEE